MAGQVKAVLREKVPLWINYILRYQLRLDDFTVSYIEGEFNSIKK